MAQMNPRAHHSPEDHAAAIAQIGLRPREDIALEFGISTRTLRRWETSYQQTMSYGRREGSGFNRSTSALEDAVLVGYMRANPFQTVTHAVDVTGFTGKLQQTL
jgi:transposase-like protein